MLKLTNVQKRYGDFCLDCSLSVKKGMITGLIGPNGAGKSTTFKAILNLIRTDGGKIEIFGKDSHDITAADRQKLGVALAESGFSGYLNVKAVSNILSGFYPAFDKEEFLRNCYQQQLPLDKDIKDFSTGMKAKLKVLAAMSHKAKLLILDEPTSGLDVLAREDILEMLNDYLDKNKDSAILISSHISTDLEKICDDLYLIKNGKTIYHEDTDKLLSDYAIIKADEEQYQKIDKQYLLASKKENYGYCLLTNQMMFYKENYPHLVVEKADIDDFILLMIKGEVL